MLVVMQQGATEEQIEAVIERLTELGFDVHRSTGVMHTVLGGVGGKDEFDLDVFEADGWREGSASHQLALQAGQPSFKPGGHGGAKSAMWRSAGSAWW